MVGDPVHDNVGMPGGARARCDKDLRGWFARPVVADLSGEVGARADGRRGHLAGRVGEARAPRHRPGPASKAMAAAPDVSRT